jgi:hypothetical protein
MLARCLSAPVKLEFFFWLLYAHKQLLQFLIGERPVYPARRSRVDEVVFNGHRKVRLDQSYIHEPLARGSVKNHLQNALAHGISLGFPPSRFFVIWLLGLWD